MFRLPAAAKLNLFLHITGRRSDGYHELQTVFQFIDLCDELEFECLDQGGIELLGDDCGVSPAGNLVQRAAHELSSCCGRSRGARIRLRKRIPIGGGLGGGSSDAATTLLALNKLWGCGLSIAELAAIGARLGADVPIFIHGHASWAEGIGDRLQTLELEQPWYLLIHPGCAVNTAAIFGHPELTRNTPPIKIAAFLRQGGHNDCEPVVRRLYADVDQALEWLGKFTATARLTGTGSCLFGQFATRDEAEATGAAVPHGWKAYIVRGMNRSATHLALYD